MKPKPARKPAPSDAPPSKETIAGICTDLVCGFDLTAACRAHGTSIALMRRGLASRAAAWVSVQSQIRAAQVERRRTAAAHLESAAAKGAPAALAIMAARMAAPDENLEEPPADPVAWIRWRLRDVQRRIATADGIAYNQLLRQETELRGQLKAETSDTGEGRTPAEVMASESAHARELADVHLQLYLVEYLRRHHGLFLSSSAGRIEIVG